MSGRCSIKIIQEVTDLIHEEIHDAKRYAKLAIKVKGEFPALAQVFYNLSTQEEGHQAALHAEVVKLIEQYRRTKGEPPASMLAVYDYLHKQAIEKLADVRRYQEIYKNA